MSTPRLLLSSHQPSVRCSRLGAASELCARPHHQHAPQHAARPTASGSRVRSLRALLRSESGCSSRRASSTTASSSTAAAASSPLRAAAVPAHPGTRAKNLIYGTSLVLALAFGYLYVTDTRAGIHQWAVVPSLRWIYEDAEEAHEVGTKALRSLHLWGLHPRERGNPDKQGDLEVEVFGHVLSNPIGTSAGIDKHADIPSPLLALGPAIVEIGGTTPFPQEGNPKPRVFRLPSQNALINRYGLNSEGAEFIAMRLRERVRQYAYASGLGIDEDAERVVLDGDAGVPPGSLALGKLMAVQVAKNKFTPDEDVEAVKRDYVTCVDHLSKYADIIVVNVSSPNTPGLRTLQRIEPLTNILSGVVGAAKSTKRKSAPAVMVKISPDEDSDEQISGICDAVWASGVDGVIVGNTTKRRPDPLPRGYALPEREAKILMEEGGYSGPQLFEQTLALVKKYRNRLDEGPSKQPEQSGTAQSQSSEASSSPQGSPSTSDPTSKPRDASMTPDPPPAPKPGTEDASKKAQPLFRIPDRHSSDAPEADSSSASIFPSPSDLLPSSFSSSSTTSKESAPTSTLSKPPARSSKQSKVIFATGGITNGKEALEVLNAGASVAMVYTALVYGGVGTISRIKSEMRDELEAQKR